MLEMELFIYMENVNNDNIITFRSVIIVDSIRLQFRGTALMSVHRRKTFRR